MSTVSIQTIVQDTLAGFTGVELVEIERLPQGLLSITIDEPNNPLGVSIEHCEQLTRQLQAVFFVEDIAYERLEVGSPGVNRPLNKPADFVRFAGERVTLKLREAFQNRKTYTGVLQMPELNASELNAFNHTQQYTLALESQALSKTQQKKLAKTLAATAQTTVALNFGLDEIEWVRLDPHLDFKGKQS